MSKDRTITQGKLPQRTCPCCGAQVLKVVYKGELSYQCKDGPHNGLWTDAVPYSTLKTTVKHEA